MIFLEYVRSLNDDRRSVAQYIPRTTPGHGLGISSESVERLGHVNQLE